MGGGALLAGEGSAADRPPRVPAARTPTPLEPLRRAAGLERVVVTTLQAASGSGRAGLDALAAESADPLPALDARARAVADDSPFPARLAHNAVPLCDALEPRREQVAVPAP